MKFAFVIEPLQFFKMADILFIGKIALLRLFYADTSLWMKPDYAFQCIEKIVVRILNC